MPQVLIELISGSSVIVPGTIKEVNDLLVVAYESKKNAIFHKADFRGEYLQADDSEIVVSPEKITALVQF